MAAGKGNLFLLVLVLVLVLVQVNTLTGVEINYSIASCILHPASCILQQAQLPLKAFRFPSHIIPLRLSLSGGGRGGVEMGGPESIPNHQNPPKSTKSTKIHPNPPESTRIHQNPPKSTKIHQNPSKSTIFLYGNAKRSVKSCKKCKILIFPYRASGI